MIVHARLAVLALAVAAPCAASPGPADSGAITAEEQAQFDLLKKRRLERTGTPLTAAGIVTVPVVGAPVAVTPKGFHEREKATAVEFNKEFGAGAYEGIVGFTERCKYADGCNRLASMNLITSAYSFVELRRDVEAEKFTPESDAYRGRHEEIKGDMRTTMEKFTPRSGIPAAAATEFIKFSDPIIKKVFTPDELVKYVERNAQASDAAPFYDYLGRTLNGTGPPSRAQAAFDEAIKRDPKNADSFSGRAESRFNSGDYPGAVSDARAALKLNPKHERAYATLKFSEGRVRAGTTPDGADNPGGAGGTAAGGAGSAASGYASAGGAGAALAAAGSLAPLSFDALRRSDGLVADARRSLTLGDSAAAVALLSKAVELNPSNATALALMAMAHIRGKNYPEALAAAEAGLKLAPNSGPLLDAKANALNYMKDYRGALAAADLAILANPNDAVAHYNRAWALGGLRDREGALAALKTAASLNPQFAPALESALSLPQTSDLIYLFPGEAAAKSAPAAPGPGFAPPSWLLPAGAAAGVLALTALILGARRKRSPAPPPLASSKKLPGLLDGKFEVGRQIGSGGMGMVYEGRDRSLDRPVAVKRMREEIRFDQRERRRFVDEAKLVAKLHHPHIVEIHAIVEQDGEVYLIFEYIEGKTLDQVIERDKKIPFERARDLFRGVASALDYAHGRGVIHRDLKPANLMVDGAGRVRVMDYGIARLTEEAISRRSKTNSVVGTPLYMAPEQEQGVARRESDVYSMALCLYEALTGKRPFGGTSAGLLMNKLNSVYDPPSRLDARLPPGLDEVFTKALNPHPDNRYSTAGNLLRALEALETPRV